MDDLTDSPPRRGPNRLQSWVDDFIAEGHAIAGSVRILAQEDDDIEDTGLVLVQLASAPSTVHIAPAGYDQLRWECTLSPSPDDTTLSLHHLVSLAAELVVAGNLCTYLQWRSLEWDRDSGTR